MNRQEYNNNYVQGEYLTISYLYLVSHYSAYATQRGEQDQCDSGSYDESALPNKTSRGEQFTRLACTVTIMTITIMTPITAQYMEEGSHIFLFKVCMFH